MHILALRARNTVEYSRAKSFDKTSRRRIFRSPAISRISGGLGMFNLCSHHPCSSRTLFVAMGVGRVMSATDIVAFGVGRQLFGAAVLMIDPGGGSGM